MKEFITGIKRYKPAKAHTNQVYFLSPKIIKGILSQNPKKKYPKITVMDIQKI